MLFIDKISFSCYYLSIGDKNMVAAVFTIVLGVIAFVMFSYPIFWSYTGNGNEIFKNINSYNILNFENFDNVYYLLGQIFLVISMLFAGLMILLSLVYLIGRAAGNRYPKVEVRLIACMFFLFIFLAAIMFFVYWMGKTGKTDADISSATLGYGLLAALVAALISIFFAPSRRKGMKRNRKNKTDKINSVIKTQKSLVKPIDHALTKQFIKKEK